MQSKSDTELLREYAEHGNEPAFTEIVTRHTNVVYSVAVRQVDLPDIAAEITQSVFIGLARGARALSLRLAEHASLAGWLCRSARNIALNFRRDEFRQHSRERQVMEQLNPTPATAADWEHLRPVLDEAMSELSESDYDAVVMRFFNNQDLRSVGRALGVTDDTAQKRVTRALDKLREHLSRRGINSTASALSIVLSANAVQAAPAGLATTISSAAVLAGTTITNTITATKAIAMTTLHKTLVTATVAVLAGAGIYEARQAANARAEVQTLQQQQTPLTGQIQQLRRERDEATHQLTALREDNERLNRNTGDLLKLRGEVGVLRRQVAKLSDTTPQPITEKASANQPADSIEQTKHMGRDKSIDGRNYAAQLVMFASDNQGRFPTNWQQVVQYSKNFPVSGTNEFEMIHRQLLYQSDLGANAARTALVREYLAPLEA